ncbi:MAG: FAD-dependent oxidoreductase [Deltaproteobacteria bacterium]|nr:FAD-dependent oxidoreductase [Deltaproteobacteria bacterium]
MDSTRFLVIGAGISGLSFLNWLEPALRDFLVVEADSEIGGYCKTVVQDGFVWDYSGHFFHFKHPDIERYLVERMPGQKVLKVDKVSWIRHGDRYIDFPFQKNIHQLPHAEFLDCLHDLYFRPEGKPQSFRDMLYQKLGRGIAERFLVPYNEKLYATDLATLDVDAMGRFFPHADIADIIRNFRQADNASYNAHFTYPEGGAIQYVHALAKDLDPQRILLGEKVTAIDLRQKVATTSKGRQIRYEQLISSAPFPALLAMTGLAWDPTLYTANKVLVFNLGFDRKGPTEPHWIYYAARDLVFYRVGFYDNIFGADRMSMYVEIGLPADAANPSADEIEGYRERVLADLAKVGVVDGHHLVSHHHVLLDPAYCHITRRSQADVADKKATLGAANVHSIGRYGSWTYCSIEDNIVEARALAARMNAIG